MAIFYRSLLNSFTTFFDSLTTEELIVLGDTDMDKLGVNDIHGNAITSEFTFLGSTITSAISAQLANIGALAISAAQWTYLSLMNQGVATTDTPSFAGLLLDAPLPASEGGTGASSYTDGQLLIGNTGAGNGLTKGVITGTTNQVIVALGGGTIGLSLPQSIHTAAYVTFAKMTATWLYGVSVYVNYVKSGTWGYIQYQAAAGGHYFNIGTFVRIYMDLQVDNIIERTAGAGVTVDGVLCKDSKVEADAVTSKTLNTNLTFDVNGSAIVRTIPQAQFDALVNFLGTINVSGSLEIDTIAEKTAAAGVAVDGVVCKDSGVKLLTSGGTKALLDHYEEATHVTNWQGGAWAAGVSGDMTLTRVGRVVTALMPSTSAVGQSAQPNGAISNALVLPARFRPAVTTTFYIHVTAQSVTAAGKMLISTAGTITIYKDQAYGTFVGDDVTYNGFSATSISYQV